MGAQGFGKHTVPVPKHIANYSDEHGLSQGQHSEADLEVSQHLGKLVARAIVESTDQVRKCSMQVTTTSRDADGNKVESTKTVERTFTRNQWAELGWS